MTQRDAVEGLGASEDEEVPEVGASVAPGGGAAARAGRSSRLRGPASEVGMTTAEYAVGTVAACGFAGVLYKLLTSGTVVGLLTDIVKRALSMGV